MKKLNFLALYQLKYEDDYGEKPDEHLMGLIAETLPLDIDTSSKSLQKYENIICNKMLMEDRYTFSQTVEACKLFDIVIWYYKWGNDEDDSMPMFKHTLTMI